MTVKTFVGTAAPEVDKQVNDWLAESKVHVRRTSIAFHRFRDRGKDAITGRTIARQGVGIVISVWSMSTRPNRKSGLGGRAK
jgi:hypothetical protein